MPDGSAWLITSTWFDGLGFFRSPDSGPRSLCGGFRRGPPARHGPMVLLTVAAKPSGSSGRVWDGGDLVVTGRSPSGSGTRLLIVVADAPSEEAWHSHYTVLNP